MSRSVFQGLQESGMNQHSARVISAAVCMKGYATKEDLLAAIAVADKVTEVMVSAEQATEAGANKEEQDQKAYEKNLDAVRRLVEQHQELYDKSVRRLERSTKENREALSDCWEESPDTMASDEESRKRREADREESRKHREAEREASRKHREAEREASRKHREAEREENDKRIQADREASDKLIAIMNRRFWLLMTVLVLGAILLFPCPPVNQKKPSHCAAPSCQRDLRPPCEKRLSGLES